MANRPSDVVSRINVYYMPWLEWLIQSTGSTFVLQFNSLNKTQLYISGPVYLESKNMPDYKMGLDSDYQALMTTSGYRYNLFYPGLTGDQGTVSFESYEKPGEYLDGR